MAPSAKNGPVTADHLNARPRGEPGRQAGRLTVGQQVDGAAGLDVDEDGAVVAALPGRVLVNADNPWCGHLGLGKRVHQTKHRAAADGNAENAGDAGAGPARESAKPTDARVERNRSVC